MKATIKACSNLALIKYWGVQDADLKIPLNDSISISLNELQTTTTVEFGEDLQQQYLLNGEIASGQVKERFDWVIDRFRHKTNINLPVVIHSENNFPTAAGIASSASGFGALAHGLYVAVGLEHDTADISRLARIGSGSASRTVHPGYAHWHAGNDDGSSYSTHLKDPDDLQVLVLITEKGAKKVSSNTAMNLSKQTSPFFHQRGEAAQNHINPLIEAVQNEDFTTIGHIAQQEANNLHAVINTTGLGIYYWNDTTMRLIQKVRELQESGTECYYSIDAGPQVKVLCQPDTVYELQDHFNEIEGVKDIMSTGLGFGSKATTDHLF